MVWVGSSTGWRLPFVPRPVLSLFTGAGVDFARRAGSRLQPVQNIPVPGPWRTADLCERLERITGVEVVNGTRVSRRRAAAEVVRRTQRLP